MSAKLGNKLDMNFLLHNVQNEKTINIKNY